MIVFRDLKEVSLEEITTVFNTSFADYAVNIQMTAIQKDLRMKKARVDFGASIGAFKDGQLVGMMLIAIEEWNGIQTAHNAGTGVIPAFRGQRLVKQMYAQLSPKFKALGVQKISLEVLQENEIAIRAYKSVGMKIKRGLLCLAIDFDKTGIDGVLEQMVEVQKPDLASYQGIQGFDFAWDFNQNAIKANPTMCRSFEYHQNNQLIAYCIVNTEGNTILQAGVVNDNWSKYGPILMKSIAAISRKTRWMNIDGKAINLVAFLKEFGFTSLVNQYEMSGLLDV